jgi:DNA-binding transcriptional ArsR family regulator
VSELSGSGTASVRESDLVELDDAAADELFDALATETARAVLVACHERPRTAAELAEAVDADGETVRNCLSELAAADLVTVVGARDEADVYAPADTGLVVVGDGADGSNDGYYRRLAGVLAALAVGGLAVGLVSPDTAVAAATFVGGGLLVLVGLVAVDSLLS